MPNRSPWTYQLKLDRPILTIPHNIECDVNIIGAGIAGIVTAYFVLKYTSLHVCVCEANRVAHGATGHNAGQIVSYFERSFSSIAEEYGVKMAAQGQRDVYSGWDLIDEIVGDMDIKAPFFQFAGYAGCSTLQQIEYQLNDLYNQRLGGLQVETILIADEYRELMQFGSQYEDLYSYTNHAEILELLQTTNPKYMAALVSRKGCMNSALFTEELAHKLQQRYPDRFQLFEYSPIRKLILDKTEAISRGEKYRIKSKKVVLCTNGFEHIEIENKAGKDINKKFHELVNGLIGYMAAYLEPRSRDDDKASAVSYFDVNKRKYDDSYVYVTRREYEYEKDLYHNLVCVSGPEQDLPDKSIYERQRDFPDKFETQIVEFIKQHFYEDYEKLHFVFKWHGLMGYTPNGLRCVGREPLNPILMYNLGCNGIGILPSVFGGRKIAGILEGKKYSKSIFDPASNLSSTYRIVRKIKGIINYLKDL
jgi:glycine/D-amino acid oxidase-like deaminating enzyme